MRDDHADVSQRAEDQVDSAYGPALPWMGFRTDGCRRAGHAMMKTHVRVVPKGETPTRLCVSNASCGPSDGRSVQQLLHNTQKSTGGPRHPRRLPCARPARAACMHVHARDTIPIWQAYCTWYLHGATAPVCAASRARMRAAAAESLTRASSVPGSTLDTGSSHRGGHRVDLESHRVQGQRRSNTPASGCCRNGEVL